MTLEPGALARALGGRKSGRGAARDAIDAAQELPDHPDCPLGPDQANAACNEDSNAGNPKQADILIAIATFADSPAPALPHSNCGSYAEINHSHQGIRVHDRGQGG
jgi:hypothetical protein